jgi:hypothetical protein
MPRITVDDTLLDIFLKMSEGNPGAMSVCQSLQSEGKNIDRDSAIQGFGALMSLDMYEIYGADIWMLYKDVCGEDIEKTIATLRSCQLGFTSSEELKYAIAHYGEGLNINSIFEQVKERLPHFGLERGDT